MAMAFSDTIGNSIRLAAEDNGCSANKAVVQGLARPVAGRQVAPAATRLQHMKDPPRFATVVNPRRPAKLARQQWLQQRPPVVAQPKLRHLAPTVGSVDHIQPTMTTRFYGSSA